MTTTSDLAQASIDLIEELQTSSGAFPASPTFSAYRGYCWFRDGSFIADGMSAVGAVGSASRFHDWCVRVLSEHREVVDAVVAAANAGHELPDSQMLPARFTFAGGDGVEPWWNFQLDGYGTWLWSVVTHAQRHNLEFVPWRQGIELAVDYLSASWDRPCFDWWEEHDEHIHVSTLGCIAAGLESAANSGAVDANRSERAHNAAQAIRTRVRHQGVRQDHLTKWLGRSDVDGSLLSLIGPIGWISPDEPVARGTVDEVERTLTIGGGVHRFADDVFYGGGQWPLLTAFLGSARLALGDTNSARDALSWIASTRVGDFLPEQVDWDLLAPERRAEWVERWGTVATPLLWSHGQYLRLWNDLGRP